MYSKKSVLNNFVPEYTIKKASVMLCEITQSTQRQDDLFAGPEKTEDSTMMGLLESVKQRFGWGGIRIIFAGCRRKGQSRSEKESQA
jgi:hypothetical protein